MKRYYAIGAMVALGVLPCAAQEEATIVNSTAEGTESATEAYLTNTFQFLRTVAEFTVLLEGVTDKASADAAVGLMDELVCEIREHLDEVKMLEEQYPGFVESAEAADLSAEIEPIVMPIMAAFAQEVRRVREADAYGCEPIMQTLIKLKL